MSFVQSFLKVFTPSTEARALAAELPEINAADLAQVQGGLPHGTWAAQPDGVVLSETDALPHGTW